MDWYNTQFVIFNVSEIDKIDFEQVMETSKNTLRKSIDNSKTFVKWESQEIPKCVKLLDTKEGPYTYEEIMEILSTDEWSKNNTVLFTKQHTLDFDE